MDIDRATTNEVAAEVGARPYCVEADVLSDNEVQAAYIATPVHLHRRQVIEAATAPLLCRDLIHRVVRHARDMQVTIVAERRRDKEK